MNEPSPNDNIESSPFSDLFLSSREEIIEALEQHKLTADLVRAKNREFIDYLGQEIYGMPSYFIKLESYTTNDLILLHRIPQILNARVHEPKYKSDSRKFYYNIGYVGLSSEGLFAVRFSEVEGNPEDLHKLNSPTERILWGYYNNILRTFDGIVKSMSQKTRETSKSEYLEFKVLEDSVYGKLPKIEVRVNLPLRLDEVKYTLDHDDKTSTVRVINLNTVEGLAIWKKIMEQFESELKKVTDVHRKDNFCYNFPNLLYFINDPIRLRDKGMHCKW